MKKLAIPALLIAILFIHSCTMKADENTDMMKCCCIDSDVSGPQHMSDRILFNSSIADDTLNTLICLPNAFTPDGNSVNDDFRWTIYTPHNRDYHVEVKSLEIFKDKKKVFSGTGNYWDGMLSDGSQATEGSYSYEVHLGNSFNEEVVYKGGFCLYRNCVPDGMRSSKLHFSDQIHPSLGYIYPTNESLKECSK